MEYSYLYEFNKERYKRIAEREFPCKEKLSEEIVENGFLLPNRYAPQRLFGHGGVLDAEQNYVKSSEMNAYAKYAFTPGDADEKEIYMGEGYAVENSDVPYLEEDVVYLGYINNHWGHFLLDATARLYYFIQNEEKPYKYAYVVNEGQEYIPGTSIRRFLELLGIADKVIFISQVTRCRTIIVPEPGYMINGYYSQEFLQVFDRVADRVDCLAFPTYEKVYYSRAAFKKAQGSEVGEELLLELFEKNDFTIISPEQYTLDEQIAIIRNTEFLAGMAGTLPHNLLFAKPGQKMLILNKTHNLNMAQMDINRMRQVNVTYVDAYLAKFPVFSGEGPFLLEYSEELDCYARDHGLEPLTTERIAQVDKKRSSSIYEERYRLKHTGQTELYYPKDERMFDYFAPEHLVQYEEKFYYVQNPVKLTERIKVFAKRAENALKRMKKK